MKILVTGATGNTGKPVVKQLLDKGQEVRAFVRTLDDRSEELASLGAEVFAGDLLNWAAIEEAVKGVDRIYFVYPFKDHLTKSAAYFAKAAKKHGVKQLVNMSQMNAHEESSSPATQSHLISEEIFDWAHVNAVHIRPGLFSWNYLNFAGPTIKAESKFYFPNPEARFTVIHPEDIAEAVVSLLLSTDPAIHSEKRYNLAGPEVFTNESLTKVISEMTQTSVGYVPIPVETWIDAIKADPYINDFLAKHLQEFSKDIASGKFDIQNDHVETLTGHPPRSFQQYVKENLSYFKN